MVWTADSVLIREVSFIQCPLNNNNREVTTLTRGVWFKVHDQGISDFSDLNGGKGIHVQLLSSEAM